MLGTNRELWAQHVHKRTGAKYKGTVTRITFVRGNVCGEISVESIDGEIIKQQEPLHFSHFNLKCVEHLELFEELVNLNTLKKGDIVCGQYVKKPDNIILQEHYNWKYVLAGLYKEGKKPEDKFTAAPVVTSAWKQPLITPAQADKKDNTETELKVDELHVRELLALEEAKCESLKNEVHEIKKRLEQEETKCESFETELNEVKERLSLQETECGTLKTGNQQLKTDIENTTVLLAGAKEDKSKLEKQLSDAIEDVTGLKARLTVEENKCMEMESTISNLQKTKLDIDAQNTLLKTKLKDYENQIKNNLREEYKSQQTPHNILGIIQIAVNMTVHFREKYQEMGCNQITEKITASLDLAV